MKFLRALIPALVAAVALTGCGKIQSMLGMGDDGGAGSSGGGILGALKKDEGLAFLSGFEGQIDIAVRAKARGNTPETINLSLLVKDKRFRADIPPSAMGANMPPLKGFGVLDAQAKKAFVVTDTPEKMAIVFDLNKTGEQLKGLAKPSVPSAPGKVEAPKPPPKVTKTGRKDKVAGYECEDWEIVGEDGKMTMCVAQQGFSWLQIPLLGAPAEYAWMGELLDGTHFPLRIVAFEKNGQESGRGEVTKIEKKPLAANLFEVPPGYPQMTMEQMMAKMMGGLGRLPPGALPPGALPPGALPPGAAKGPPPKGK